jgi:phosphoribosylaminoimidazolecarboxamide formyltransferase/IMP cyclohydrolase
MPLALFSLSNKRGLVEFAQELINLGWELMASGGTAQVLREASIPVQDVADYTGSPEILEGRVKTLHPTVAGGLLARSTEAHVQDLDRIGGRFIDLVACNLYPFHAAISTGEVALEDAIENIDIGGVTLLRAAAKNFQRVTAVSDPQDYEIVLAELSANDKVSLDTRRRLAEKAFALTASYDAAITRYLARESSVMLELHPVQHLRYGENWHQEADLFSFTPQSGPMGGEFLQGKPLSYNNLLDLDAAWRAVNSFDRPTVCIVKHLSPCGIASANLLAEAYQLALQSDPVSAYGGVIAVNRTFDVRIAQELGDLFVECITAPDFSADALALLSRNGNLRLLKLPRNTSKDAHEYRSIWGGMLRQSVDWGDPEGSDWKIVTGREPTPEEWLGLRFAWKACQHVKSNAIVYARREATVGIGGGQPNRVDCVHIAAQRAGDRSMGAVMASDAFFPFPDSVEAAATHGITAIIQPGGSVRDDLSIQACDHHDIAMVFTGVRHFRH